MFNPFYLDCASEQLLLSFQEEEQCIDRKRLTHSTRFNVRSPSEHIYQILPGQIGHYQPYGLKLFVEGRLVTGADPQIGWNHQGMEKRLEETPWAQIPKTVKKITHREGSAIEVAFQSAYDEMRGAEGPNLALQLERIVQVESERIAHHHTVLARVNLLLGLKTTSLFDMEKNWVVRERLSGKAKVDRNSALSLGLSGITLRATGFADDLRLHDDTYSLLEFRPQLRIESDAYARYLLRIAEIIHSQTLIDRAQQLLAKQAEQAVTIVPSPVASRKHCAAFIEGPEGEVMIWIASGDGAAPDRMRIKTPSFALAYAIPAFLIGADIDDVAIILATLGINAYELDR